MAEDGPDIVHVICGPTASGKSALAVALAERLGGTVINADSMQVYAGLEVLTDQPGAAQRARAPHRLYGLLDAADGCSAGRWRDMALTEIAASLAERRPPVVVGGTGLYLKALMEGIAPIPEVPPTVRAEMRARHDEIGDAAFHAAWIRRDPESFATIGATDTQRMLRAGATDTQRMLRAAEVLEATGQSLSKWQRAPVDGPPPGMGFRSVLLMPPRAEIYDAIEQRFQRMLATGAVAEAERLAARGLDPGLPAMKALGVAQLIAAAEGRMTIEAAAEKAVTATRNYAKRQETWFNGQMIADMMVSEKFSERNLVRIFSDIL
jgi:tRNA dimethylallyltransferase